MSDPIQTASGPIPPGETGFDTVLAFTLPDRHARGRVVRLGPTLDTILSAHDYPTAIRHLLGEALVLTTLLGSLLNNDDAQLTMQVQAEGSIVDLLVCDYRAGEIRGYVRHDAERLAALTTFPSLDALVGTGYLAVTFDNAADNQRYQGIVPLEGPSLSAACEAYFARSEQIPTLIRTGIRWDSRGCVAGGFLVQHLAEGEEGRTRLHVRLDHPEWQHVEVMAGTIKHAELVDENLSMEAIVWRLFHEEREVRVERLGGVARGCRCTAEYYASVLNRFPENERAEMRDESGAIVVDCAFCSRKFRILD